ncbi:WD40 repeat-like protein [Glarea lozoyensis ATCC 20868]|uniref:WD40 repeat-like protein n=1 Tax=Glarea lozoyensis (strain ATCC 20868 / MF5171) TaxID=1116229 RepID=S3DDA7_GLAL2|nr:WD40 repeat-like protein [Glarea lozoyensis ATCC 20868]EPE24658.1 WD40 repeat-like protein [Glarea lozoyensis ATCC 20868]
MASILKRKRGGVEVLDTPKRAKSVKKENGNSTLKVDGKVDWEKAAEETSKMKELVKVNGENLTNGDAVTAVSEQPQNKNVQKKKNTKGLDAPETDAGKSIEKPSLWKLSESIAGRMSSLEPVFTADEKHLLVTTRTAVLVYTAANSLLTRSIKLHLAESEPNTRIVSFSLSPTAPEIVWVACSDGNVYRVNWMTGEGASYSWKTSSTGCNFMTVAAMESLGRRRDVVFTTEAKGDGWRVTANELTAPDDPIKTAARTIYTSKDRIRYLKTGAAGSVVVAAAGNKIIVGGLRTTEYGVVSNMKYEFRIFETSDTISSLDVKATPRPDGKDVKKSLKRTPIVDLVVGDVRGSIFLHNDLLANLMLAQDGKPGISLTPRKMHWHRQAVNAVKWSRDGNYIISGGNETVLVIWQLDTGSHQYLPHLSSTIQQIVVSPTGSSYAVQLADNSAMILSTAELTPTTNIAGIQASTIAGTQSLESEVERIGEEQWPSRLIQRTPALINPNFPSKLLLAVGQTQEIDPVNPLVTGSPYLQTFDLGTGHNASRQALSRSNVTIINSAPSAHKISEPRVTHMKISHDGKWLATVDEWTPPARDLTHLALDKNNAEEERLSRREIYLKFWEWSDEDNSWQLVSRIDAPHTLSQNSTHPGRVLDLAVDPNSSKFVTVGEDEIVCTWSTRTRKRDGVPVRGSKGQVLRNWYCQHAISLGKQEMAEDIGHIDASVAGAALAFSEDGSVLAAATSSQDGIVHFIEPNSGSIRQSQTGIFQGHLVKMDFLGQDLIVLADQLTLYDLVSNEIRMNFKLNIHLRELSIAQKQEMIHLAADLKSRTFAVSFPIRCKDLTVKKEKSLTYQQSELFIFHQDELQPQLHDILPIFITALLPAADSDGFLLLDTAAEIRTAHKKGSQILTAMAQSTSALLLDDSAEVNGVVVPTDEDEEMEDEDVQLLTPAATEDGNDDEDENDTPVVTAQQLAQVFDIGPAFALPPLEVMFYQVAGLFAGKPMVRDV